ncbi:ribonuclease HII [Coprothermobacter platensis]|uniref:ribonuclease HII n=1 Tax=Coprothermobacter platensis TaxID=108819 RepID=UPI00036A271D|nr:ribonuclease HII [Coprothermobacter platensis]
MKDTPSWELEHQLFGDAVVGVDEVGRGSVAGPLIVCAARFHDFPPVTWRDSKQMTPRGRKNVFPMLLDSCDFGIGMVMPWDIDKHGITWALSYAAEEALSKVYDNKSVVVFDGRIPLTRGVKNGRCMVKGDALLPTVAAASVIAKVTRDELMVCLDGFFPKYDLCHNKGYGTKKHLEAVRRYGVTNHHRRSFLRSFVGEE